MDKIYLLAQYGPLGGYQDYYCIKSKTENEARTHYIMMYGLSKSYDLRTLGIFMKEDDDKEYTFLVMDKNMDLDVIYSNKFYDVNHIGINIEITDEDSRNYFTDLIKLSAKSPVRKDYLVARKIRANDEDRFFDHQIVVASSIDEAAAKYRKNYATIADNIQVLGYFVDNKNFRLTMFTMDSILGKYADDINEVHMKRHLMDDE